VSARWLDLVDPTREELLGALPVHVDPEVVEILDVTDHAAGQNPYSAASKK